MRRSGLCAFVVAACIVLLLPAASARSDHAKDAAGTIVYDSWTALWGWTSTDLYAIVDDGSAPRQLTSDASSEFDPRWSPDGSQLAYASDTESSNLQVYVADANAQNPRRITEGSKSWSSPSWSPDGRKLVVAGDTPGRDYASQIYTMNANGTGLRRITGTGGDKYPEWSPDGKWIAFSRYDGESDAFHLYLVRPDGSYLRRLSGGRLSAMAPSWSPDSRHIAFQGWTDENGDYNEINEPAQLYVIDVVTGKIRQLIDGLSWDELPCWSPDGTRIAFARSMAHGWAWARSPGGVGWVGAYLFTVTDLFVINVDGTGLKQLTNSPHTVEQSCDWK